MKTLSFLLSLTLLTGACDSSQPTNYDSQWGVEDLAGPKADGLADDARALQLGAPANGAVTATSIELYSIFLTKGDKLEVVMETTSGDLAPHVTMHRGLLSSIRSESFSVDGQELTKTYEVTSTGTFFFAARAFQHQGAGDYSLVAKCTGGPCNGEFPPVEEEELFEDEIDSCLAEAFSCALDEIKRFNGAVGPVRAKGALDTCLSDVVDFGTGFCRNVCDSPTELVGFGQASDVCEDIVRDLQFYADQPLACETVLEDCLDECTDGFSQSGDFLICYSFGFNGTCGSYAPNRTECGGIIEEGTRADCYLFCESTDGAFNDDLDVMCEEDCGGERPDILEDII